MDQNNNDNAWLPDLCHPLALLRLMLLAIFVAVVLSVLRDGLAGFAFERIGVLFLYSVWVVFISAAGLCQLRKLMHQFSVALGTVMALLWICLLYTSPSPRDA